MISVPAASGFAAAAGLALGSFAVTTGLRMSEGGLALVGRSRCDHCRKSLSFAETVPVISYLASRGACRRCKARIDRTHLIGEVIGALVVLTAVLLAAPVRAIALSAAGLLLLATATVDWKSGRLPDVFAIGVAALGAALSASRGPDALAVSAGVAGVTATILLSLRWMRSRTGRDPGLGLGDVKLIAALALWLGPLTPWFVALAAVLGLALSPFAQRSGGRMPFGPAIAAAAWIVGLGQEAGAWPTIM
jgi:leader peptidase (prepilin peptidase)/N-methyltransferase